MTRLNNMKSTLGWLMCVLPVLAVSCERANSGDGPTGPSRVPTITQSVEDPLHHDPAANPSINLVNQPGCTPDGSNLTGSIRVANTGSGGSVQIASVDIEIFWQAGGGNWNSADPHLFTSLLDTGTVIDVGKLTFPYDVSFTAPASARKFRSVVQVTLVGRADIFSETRHFKLCGT
jgi:hypothetical protein